MSQGNILSAICRSLEPCRVVRLFDEDHPIGEIGLGRPVLGFALGAESARKIHSGVGIFWRPRPTEPSYTDKKGLVLQKCAEEMRQLYLCVNAIGGARRIF